MKAQWMLALMIATASATGVALAGDTKAGASTGTMEQGEVEEGPTTMHTNRSTMESLDLDQDGAITSDEADTNQQLSEQFEQLDRNGDDMLDQGEFARFEGAYPSESESEESSDN